MLPLPKIAPKKIGGPGPSKRKAANNSNNSSSSTSLTFNSEERAELRRLSSLLPPKPENGDPSQIVLDAASYIQQLVATVHARVNNGTLPKEALLALPPAFSTTSNRRSGRIQKKRRSVEKKR